MGLRGKEAGRRKGYSGRKKAVGGKVTEKWLGVAVRNQKTK